MTHDSVLFAAIRKLVKPGPSTNPDENAQMLMTIVADDFIKMLHAITPDLEDFVHRLHLLPHRSRLQTDVTTPSVEKCAQCQW